MCKHLLHTHDIPPLPSPQRLYPSPAAAPHGPTGPPCAEAEGCGSGAAVVAMGAQLLTHPHTPTAFATAHPHADGGREFTARSGG